MSAAVEMAPDAATRPRKASKHKDHSNSLPLALTAVDLDRQALMDLPPIPQPKLWSDLQERLWTAYCSRAVPISVAGEAIGIDAATQSRWWTEADAYDADPSGPHPPHAAAASALLKRLKRADNVAHAGIIDRLYTEKAWQASAWIGERRYGYRQNEPNTGQAISINIGVITASQGQAAARVTLDVGHVHELPDPRRPQPALAAPGAIVQNIEQSINVPPVE